MAASDEGGSFFNQYSATSAITNLVKLQDSELDMKGMLPGPFKILGALKGMKMGTSLQNFGLSNVLSIPTLNVLGGTIGGRRTKAGGG